MNPWDYRVYLNGECLCWLPIREVVEITSVFQCVVDAQFRTVTLI